MGTTSLRLSFPKRATGVLVATVLVFALHAIPNATTPQAQASVCSVPVIGVVCDVFSGSVGGIKFLVTKATGAIKNIATKKVIGWVTKAGCVAGAGAVTDGIGAGVMAGICAKASDWLLNKLAGTNKTPTPTATTNGNGAANGNGATNGNGAGGNNNNGANNNSSTPPDGTPASALSTAPMAALAGAATLFIADHISSDTQANLTGGWFQPLYAGIERYAWLLAVLAVGAGAIYVMVSARGGELMMLLGRIPFAAVAMVGVPVIAMSLLSIIDLMCSDLMKAFPDGIHMLHVTAGILGVLGGASVLANLLGHSTISHFTGTGAWMIGAFGLLSSGAIALELIAREIAVYLTILVVPLALVGEIFSPFARWATGLIKALFVIIIVKLFLAMGLVVSGTLMITGLKNISPIMVIVGIVALALIALFPALIWGALIRIESAWHSGMGHTAISAPQTTMANHLRTTHTRVQTAMATSSLKYGGGNRDGSTGQSGSNGTNGSDGNSPPPNRRPPSSPQPPSAPPPPPTEEPPTPVPEPA